MNILHIHPLKTNKREDRRAMEDQNKFPPFFRPVMRKREMPTIDVVGSPFCGKQSTNSSPILAIGFLSSML
jgi:hypothetical protein